jgi:AraC-like DNA-binding protein
VTEFFGRDETLAHLSSACAELLSAETAGSAKRIAALAHLLAICIAQKFTNVASQRPDYRGGLPIARLRKIKDYVRGHLAESISIETLAESAELSPFHFSRVFKRATGMTPLQFVTRERMLQAQQLIRETHPAASSKSRSQSATLVRAILLRYFGGWWEWLQRSATPSKRQKSAPLFRKNTTGAARSRERPLGRWPMVSPSLIG